MVSYDESVDKVRDINPAKGNWTECNVTYPYEVKTDKYNIIKEKNGIDLLVVPLVRSPRETNEPKNH